MSKFIALIFILFALMNINDPDGFIWVPTYVAVGILPLFKKAKQQYLNIFATLIFIIGLLILFGFLNKLMPQQIDERMVNLWEYQREGIGLILGAIWLAFGSRLNNSHIK